MLLITPLQLLRFLEGWIRWEIDGIMYSWSLKLSTDHTISNFILFYIVVSRKVSLSTLVTHLPFRKHQLFIFLYTFIIYFSVVIIFYMIILLLKQLVVSPHQTDTILWSKPNRYYSPVEFTKPSNAVGLWATPRDQHSTFLQACTERKAAHLILQSSAFNSGMVHLAGSL